MLADRVLGYVRTVTQRLVRRGPSRSRARGTVRCRQRVRLAILHRRSDSPREAQQDPTRNQEVSGLSLVSGELHYACTRCAGQSRLSRSEHKISSLILRYCDAADCMKMRSSGSAISLVVGRRPNTSTSRTCPPHVTCPPQRRPIFPIPAPLDVVESEGVKGDNKTPIRTRFEGSLGVLLTVTSVDWSSPFLLPALLTLSQLYWAHVPFSPVWRPYEI